MGQVRIWELGRQALKVLLTGMQTLAVGRNWATYTPSKT